MSVAGDVRVSACGRTDAGMVRSDNQDDFLVLDLARPDPGADREVIGDGDGRTFGPVDFALAPEGAVLLVADGMGGRASGAKASRMAVESVRAAMGGAEALRGQTAAQFARRLVRALEAADETIRAEAQRDLSASGMGTTATLVGIFGACAYVAQVGDSRAYLARRGSVGRLTKDQSLVQDLIDSGVLSEGEAERVPNNMILQAVGTGPTMLPALTYHELRRGDVLLLCSDGLSRVVTDAELAAHVTEAEDCAALCEALVDLANERGGPDNVTVLAARVDGRGVPRPTDGEEVTRLPYEAPAE